MARWIKHPARDLGYSLMGPDYLPPSDEECALRDVAWQGRREYRPLKSGEIEQLTNNGNTAADWGNILVSERFNPRLVQGCRFFGLVRLGSFDNIVLECDGVKLPVGLYDSTIVSCDLGDNVAVDHVGYLAYYLLDDEVVLQSVGRMMTTRLARFGHGTLKGEEAEDARRWIDTANENGGRAILAFDGILPADAALWVRGRGREGLHERLVALTDARFDRKPGYYGTVGTRSIVRDTRTVVDAAIGAGAIVDGAERLENITIRSTKDDPVWIGSGVSLSDGIVGFGCRVETGAQASRFILGEGVRLGMGARLVHSFLGDNGVLRGGEMIATLAYPFFVQSHGNSMIISAHCMGQSNMAAGATLGSNHNTRAADGELLAGRGFWPGLSISLKFNCRFASYTLLARDGHYPAELNVPLPFSLVSSDFRRDCLQIMPAYWLLYDIYALVRNEQKFVARDSRVHRQQHVETQFLAPDTTEEMLAAMALLEQWTARAKLRAEGKPEPPADDLREIGRRLLVEEPQKAVELEVLADGVENSRRKVVILKPERAWAIYEEMTHYYAVRELLAYMESQAMERPDGLAASLMGRHEHKWINLGGQLVSASDLEKLTGQIASGEIDSWPAVHSDYDRLWEDYPTQKARHAYAVLILLADLRDQTLTSLHWIQWLKRAMDTQKWIAEQVNQTRRKDFQNPFRRMCYEDDNEMAAVLGSPDRDPVIALVREQTEAMVRQVERITRRLEG